MSPLVSNPVLDVLSLEGHSKALSAESNTQTRRLFAAAVLNSLYLGAKTTGHTDAQIAFSCVTMADALLAELDKKEVAE